MYRSGGHSLLDFGRFTDSSPDGASGPAQRATLGYQQARGDGLQRRRADSLGTASGERPLLLVHGGDGGPVEQRLERPPGMLAELEVQLVDLLSAGGGEGEALPVVGLRLRELP